jgi:hypothetical protein
MHHRLWPRTRLYYRTLKKSRLLSDCWWKLKFGNFWIFENFECFTFRSSEEDVFSTVGFLSSRCFSQTPKHSIGSDSFRENPKKLLFVSLLHLICFKMVVKQYIFIIWNLLVKLYDLDYFWPKLVHIWSDCWWKLKFGIFGFLKASNASLIKAAKTMNLAPLDCSLQGTFPKPKNFLLALTVFERILKNKFLPVFST